jgi:hypothetical protein
MRQKPDLTRRSFAAIAAGVWICCPVRSGWAFLAVDGMTVRSL